jgi:hypothetical protein
MIVDFVSADAIEAARGAAASPGGTPPTMPADGGSGDVS